MTQRVARTILLSFIVLLGEESTVVGTCEYTRNIKSDTVLLISPINLPRINSFDVSV